MDTPVEGSEEFTVSKQLVNFAALPPPHEAISRLVEAGFSDLEVASISGHKDMKSLKRYTHLRNEKFVERLDSAKRLDSKKRLRSLKRRTTVEPCRPGN